MGIQSRSLEFKATSYQSISMALHLLRSAKYLRNYCQRKHLIQRQELLIMQEKLFTFLSSPGRDTYFAIREEVIASEHYNPHSLELNAAISLLAAGDHIQAREVITGSMPNLLLSPIAHQLLSRIAEQLNDQESAESEHAIGSLCLRGLLATGDGSQDKPYIVVRISDEYDVVHCLGKQMVEQSLIADGDKRYDLLRCADGSELWFEITDALRRRQQLSKAVYQVRLSQVGSNRVKVMALIREIWGLPVTETKTLIDSPKPLLGTIPSRQRKDVQTKFTQAGATVEIEAT